MELERAGASSNLQWLPTSSMDVEKSLQEGSVYKLAGTRGIVVLRRT